MGGAGAGAGGMAQRLRALAAFAGSVPVTTW